MKRLTLIQTAVLHFLRTHQVANGSMPTRVEIARHFEWTSPNSAESHIAALCKLDCLVTVPGVSRGLRFTPRGLDIVGQPLAPFPRIDERLIALPVIDMGKLNAMARRLCA